MALYIALQDGSDRDDICDYCRRQTGEEIIVLNLTSKKWRDNAYIQIHSKCMTRQIDKLRKARNVKED